MTMTAEATAVATPPDPASHSDWQPLPARARSLFVLTDALVLAGIGAFATGMFATIFDVASPLLAAPIGLLLGAALGAYTGNRRYRRTFWLLDDDGFALLRGNLWRRETRVPASRVQHLDLKHGPLERRWRLATLAIHTAGSKMSAVSVSGLDEGDAERLRDRLARQLDRDDDAL
jgi:membrane protein YdbS with pleckstrin-like domain